jgi:hypothetical protein
MYPARAAPEFPYGANMRNRVLTLFLFLLVVGADVGWAQFSSAVQGIVRDPSRSVVPSARVSLLNVSTGVTQETVTNDAGFFRFSSLPPGDYEASVTGTGFQVAAVKFTLTTGQTRGLDFDLELASTATSVHVTAEAPPLDTAETRLQLTMQQSKIRDLPLLNNSIFALLSLAPGVTGVNSASDNFNPEYFSSMSANGRSAYGNTFNVDGLNTTSNISNGTSNLGVNPEAVSEVLIETNTFKAEQGLGSSIVVSVTTKAGTNEFHGAGNYWFTNQDMRARTSLPFIARYQPFQRQNVNGAFGGPIVKNRTFFFTSVEMLRSKNAATSVETWESPEFVNWARANFPNSLGTQLLTQNPVDGPVQTTVLRTAQNVLGAECGTPTYANIPCNLPMVVQGAWNRSPYRNGLQYNFRGDQYLRDGRDRIYGSFIRTESENANLVNRSNMNNFSNRFVNAFQANWTHTFTPTLLNEFGASGNKVLGTDGAGAPFRIPQIGIQGSTGLGPGFAGTFVQHNYNWRDVVTWVKGSHTLKFGGNYYWGDDYADFPNSPGGAGSRPSFTFLNLVDLVRDQPFSGNFSAHDPLTGQPKAYTFGAKLNSFGLFIQDEWKVRPNLSLTMSMRWDDFGNPVGIRNWRTTNIFVADGNTVDQQFANAAIRETPKSYPGRLNKNFSPRFGVAYSPGDSRKWSIRGGVGLYNDWVTLGEIVDRVNVNPPNFLFPAFGVNLPLQPLFSVGNSDTFPYGFTYPTIPAAQLDARGGIVGLQSNVGGIDPNLRTPKTVNYIIGVERELPGRTVVGINYSGSRTWDALVGTDHNRFPGDLLDGRLDRLNPSFGAMHYVRNFNKMTYNSMIISARKDVGARGTLQGSYTLGRVQDYFQGGSRSVSFENVPDPRLMDNWRGDAAFDVRHRVSASGVYRLPTPFRGTPIVDRILGGWEIGTTAILQSGNPWTASNSSAFNPIRDAAGNVIGFRPDSGDYNADGFNFDLPNQPANLPRIFNRSQFLGANAGVAAYDRSQFTAPAVGQQGNAIRSYFRQQGLINIDTSVIKNNYFRERMNLQLKFEFFNALNRVNLGGINNNVGNPNFGRILGQRDPRVVQVGARFAF